MRKEKIDNNGYKVINFWISKTMLEELDKVVSDEMLNRSIAIRKAIDFYIKQHKRVFYSDFNFPSKKSPIDSLNQ